MRLGLSDHKSQALSHYVPLPMETELPGKPWCHAATREADAAQEGSSLGPQNCSLALLTYSVDHVGKWTQRQEKCFAMNPAFGSLGERKSYCFLTTKSQYQAVSFISDYAIDAHYCKFSHCTDLPRLQMDQMILPRRFWRGSAVGNMPLSGETGTPYLMRQR